MSQEEKIRTLRADKAYIEQQIEELHRTGAATYTRDQLRNRLGTLEEQRDAKERDIQSLLNP